MTFLYDIIGWIGAIMTLVAYLLLSTNKIKNGVLYQVLNFVSSVLMAIALFPKDSWFAFSLQVAWAIISVIALIGIAYECYKKRKKHQNQKSLKPSTSSQSKNHHTTK